MILFTLFQSLFSYLCGGPPREDVDAPRGLPDAARGLPAARRLPDAARGLPARRIPDAARGLPARKLPALTASEEQSSRPRQRRKILDLESIPKSIHYSGSVASSSEPAQIRGTKRKRTPLGPTLYRRFGDRLFVYNCDTSWPVFEIQVDKENPLMSEDDVWVRALERAEEKDKRLTAEIKADNARARFLRAEIKRRERARAIASGRSLRPPRGLAFRVLTRIKHQRYRRARGRASAVGLECFSQELDQTDVLIVHRRLAKNRGHSCRLVPTLSRAPSTRESGHGRS